MKFHIQKDNGVNYLHFSSISRTNTIVAIENTKITFIGTPEIVIQEGSYRYGKEIQIIAYTPKGTPIKNEKRNNSKWDKVEINLPLKEGKQIVKALYEHLFKDEQKTISFK